ncbi:MAG: hypothetical protein P8013_00670 [Candidatus Sulfobium sp.]|jgi:hypothetical protein
MKKNCWEFKRCGQGERRYRGNLVKCPVPEMTSSDGINGGKNAGRICWLIAHTMCKGEAEATLEEMIETCSKCDFYKMVKEEEGDRLSLPIDVIKEAHEMSRLRSKTMRLECEDINK